MIASNSTKRDWLIAISISFAALVLVSIPYILGYAFAQPNAEYIGIVMNPEDSQSYFAKMLEGYDGNWLYTIPFTPEEHAPAFVGGFYIALGHLARFLALSPTTMWHLARIVADIFLFLALFNFVSLFLQNSLTRWVAYLLAIFGSGLGWLLFVMDQKYWLGEFPVDFKMPEAHIFFTALTFPHVAIGVVLMLISFRFSVRLLAEQGGRWLDGIASGVANLALAIVYPFMVYPVFLASLLFWLHRIVVARSMSLRKTIILGISFLIPSPLLLYYATTLATNPIFQAWDAQSITLSPPVPHYILAYGPMLLLGALVPRDQRSQFAFLWCWVVAVALLVYAPLNAQRRFVEGVHIPLAILASVGLIQAVLPRIERTLAFRWLAMRPRYSVQGLERLVLVAFLFVMSLSNLYILFSTSITASLQPVYPLFRLRSEIAAVDWLRANTSRSDIVLSAYETGNFIAARAGNRVVIGHWAETVNWGIKFKETENFYQASMNDAARRDFLERYHIAYVFFGPREREIGALDLIQLDYMKTAFSNSAIRIYSVQPK